MNNTFGLRKNDLEILTAILRQQSEVEEAYIFGSRAKGNYKNGSDVDIAIKGEKVNFSTVSRILYLLNEETNMPYQFDVLNYGAISHKELVEHINRVGVAFYKVNQPLHRPLH